MSGWTDQHQLLADRLAALESCEAAVVFPSGYAACSGVVATLPGPDDLILSDQLNHASLIDGCRSSRAKVMVYAHRDVESCRQQIVSRRSEHDQVWIVTDSVFSMDGHIAPLESLCDLADSINAILVVDEAHATGLVGQLGSGLCEALDLKHRVPIRIGTLSKAVGGQGGFVAGPQVVIDYLVNRCRTLIYSTSLSPAAVEAALTSLELIEKEPWRRQRVAELARTVRNELQISAPEIEAGIPIVPMIIGDESTTLRRSQELWDQGLYVPAIRPPTVPEGESRLRISLSAAHSDAMVQKLIDAIRYDAH